MPSQAIGDGPAMALAQLRAAESQSHWLRLWLLVVLIFIEISCILLL